MVDYVCFGMWFDEQSECGRKYDNFGGTSMQERLIIRDMVPDDYKALKPLIDELGYPSTEDEIKERLQNIIIDKNFKTLLAELNGKIVAFIGLLKSYGYEINGPYIRIMALVVAEEYRNQGIGTQLIKVAEEWAQQNGATIITLNSGLKRMDAHRFYEHMGFRIKGYSFIKEL